MTPRTARLFAVPCMLAAFALTLVTTLWVQPLTFRNDLAGLDTLADLGAHVVSAAVPLAVYAFVTRAARRRPAGFRLDPGRFRADASPYRAGPLAVVLGWTAGFGFPTNFEPDEPGLRLSSLGVVDWFSIVLIALALVAAVVALFSDRPRLTLDPAGLTLRNLFRRTRLDWAGLVAGHPRPPVSRETRTLLVRPAADPSRPAKLRTGDLHVDPAFLAFTIRQYTEQPDHRDAIGTATELSRLEAAFRV